MRRQLHAYYILLCHLLILFFFFVFFSSLISSVPLLNIYHFCLISRPLFLIIFSPSPSSLILIPPCSLSFLLFLFPSFPHFHAVLFIVFLYSPTSFICSLNWAFKIKHITDQISSSRNVDEALLFTGYFID